MRRRIISPFFLLLFTVPAAWAQEIVLQPHRATYDISLESGKGRNSLSSASGQLTYEFTGNRCEGYATKTRFLTALQGQDGKTQLIDMTSATFESGDGKEMRFVTATKSGGKTTDSGEGNARLKEDGALEVVLSKPKKDTLTLPKGILFPAQHALGILMAAKSGEPVFRADLYDGSEGAKKVYATTGIIGKYTRDAIADDNPAAKVGLAKMQRYNVALSFFDTAADNSGEQAALYDNTSIMFENGINYSMRLNYPEFSLGVKLVSLELLPAGTCK